MPYAVKGAIPKTRGGRVNMNDIRISYFHIPEESLDNVILAWQVSRTEMPYKEIDMMLEKKKV